jgi:membrane-associated protein
MDSIIELARWFIDFVLHLDVHLAELILQYQLWTYAILFAIVFAETGLVVTPILPGDSLLFAAGALAAPKGDNPDPVLNPFFLFVLLSIAAILGDTVNYWAGRIVGPAVFHKDTGRFLNKQHLMRAHEFYEKHGGMTIIIARFIPIIRTFAPFVAGIGKMTYAKFIAYNVIGGIAWPALFVYAGYWFSDTEVVRKNFTLVIMAIVVISVLPAVVEFVRAKRASRKSAT